jgi:hypothetical protein
MSEPVVEVHGLQKAFGPHGALTGRKQQWPSS